MRKEDQLMETSVYPFDLESAVEAARQTVMGRLITRHRNLLVPQPLREQAAMQVLDIGCATGGWVHDVAYAHPHAEVVGIDLSSFMLDLARSGAQGQGLNNASFERMDASKPLPFSDGSFDFVQARFVNDFLLMSTWPNAVREWVRITKPGGYIRLIECDELGKSNDFAFEYLRYLLRQAYRSEARQRIATITPYLGWWLRAAGCTHIHERPFLLNFSAPDSLECGYPFEQHLTMCQCIERAFVLLKPFLLAHQPAQPYTLDWLCQQARTSMAQTAFRGHFSYVEVVGRKPKTQERAQ